MIWPVGVLKRIFSMNIPEVPPFQDRLIERVLSERGNGEIGGNNAGPHVARYKRRPWSKKLEGKNLQPWCARGSAYCVEEALADGHYEDEAHPYELAAKYVDLVNGRFAEDCRERGAATVWGDKSRSALGLCRMLEDAFGAVGPDECPEPGMLALWKRPGASWQCHTSPVFDVGDGKYRVMQFNHGPIVKPTVHRVGDRSFGRLHLLRFVRTS